MENKSELLKIAEEAARRAGQILKNSRAEIVSNIGKDIKITSDKEAHTLIRDTLEKTGIPILSEEDSVHDFSVESKWVVDPLDGSMNFFRGIPISAVSIGLMQNGEPILGVVYDFHRDELFRAIVGEGAWLNGKPIHVSEVWKKSDAIIATGFPSYTDFSKAALEEYISYIQNFKKVRLIGSASISLAYVASGRIDIYYEKDIKIWDVAAGLALVKAAGGEYRELKVEGEGKCTVVAGKIGIFS